MSGGIGDSASEIAQRNKLFTGSCIIFNLLLNPSASFAHIYGQRCSWTTSCEASDSCIFSSIGSISTMQPRDSSNNGHQSVLGGWCRSVTSWRCRSMSGGQCRLMLAIGEIFRSFPEVSLSSSGFFSEF
ncbi:hypothetical protein F2Q69_00046223 [Brassica cretica]|uniref:Uncharacterized protein n=1 Tax=Brassica cretica TaxID=69181 RepID=A0A8S9PZK4_BRACR|nr:hypothetical protein F2Q69_00046223 [Brassica cretica]